METTGPEKILQARVDAGAALLDRKQPTWFQRIDLDRLDISACTDCVMGQLGGLTKDVWGGPSGDWEDVALALGLVTRADFADHGFSLLSWEEDWPHVRSRPWVVLTRMWRVAIEKRLADAGLLAEAPC